MNKVSKLLLLLVLTTIYVASAGPRESTGDVILAGATWHSDLEEAKALARDTGKPILLFDMVGRLDERWC